MSFRVAIHFPKNNGQPPDLVISIDDILITGRTEKEHLRTLDKVLQIMEKAGMRLKKEKCVLCNRGP